MDENLIFFTSDTHFGHEKIIQYCNRPFKSVEEMDEVMISNWNKVVPENGIVYHLGDFCFGTVRKWEEARAKLNGEIHLIIGNHDEKFIDLPRIKELFTEITYQKRFYLNNKCIYLNHYPFLCFGGAYKGSNAPWQLFGHVHSNNRSGIGMDHQRLVHCFPTQYDVGVDNNDFTPVSFKQLEEIINNRQMSLKMLEK